MALPYAQPQQQNSPLRQMMMRMLMQQMMPNPQLEMQRERLRLEQKREQRLATMQEEERELAIQNKLDAAKQRQLKNDFERRKFEAGETEWKAKQSIRAGAKATGDPKEEAGAKEAIKSSGIRGVPALKGLHAASKDTTKRRQQELDKILQEDEDLFALDQSVIDAENEPWELPGIQPQGDPNSPISPFQNSVVKEDGFGAPGPGDQTYEVFAGGQQQQPQGMEFLPQRLADPGPGNGPPVMNQGQVQQFYDEQEGANRADYLPGPSRELPGLPQINLSQDIPGITPDVDLARGNLGDATQEQANRKLMLDDMVGQRNIANARKAAASSTKKADARTKAGEDKFFKAKRYDLMKEMRRIDQSHKSQETQLKRAAEKARREAQASDIGNVERAAKLQEAREIESQINTFKIQRDDTKANLIEDWQGFAPTEYHLSPRDIERHIKVGHIRKRALAGAGASTEKKRKQASSAARQQAEAAMTRARSELEQHQGMDKDGFRPVLEAIFKDKPKIVEYILNTLAKEGKLNG